MEFYVAASEKPMFYKLYADETYVRRKKTPQTSYSINLIPIL